MRSAHIIVRKIKEDQYAVVKIRKKPGVGFDFLQVGMVIDQMVLETIKLQTNRLITIDFDGKVTL